MYRPVNWFDKGTRNLSWNPNQVTASELTWATLHGAHIVFITECNSAGHILRDVTDLFWSPFRRTASVWVRVRVHAAEPQLRNDKLWQTAHPELIFCDQESWKSDEQELFLRVEDMRYSYKISLGRPQGKKTSSEDLA
jgi:hypothetical protein